MSSGIGLDREPHVLSNRAKVASSILMLFEATLPELVRSTGLPAVEVVLQIKALKRQVGGIKGSALRGYSLVDNDEAKLKLSHWTESQY